MKIYLTERWHGFPARLQLARPGHAVALALDSHVLLDQLEGKAGDERRRSDADVYVCIFTYVCVCIHI